MSTFLRRFQASLTAHQARMAPAEAMDLGLDLRKVQDLGLLLRPTSRKAPSTPQQGGLRRPAPTWKPEKGIWIDGIRCCRLCKRPVPHKTKDANRFHMLAVKRRWMQQAAKVAWQRLGYENLSKNARINRKRRSIDQKVAIFRELAPISGAKFSTADIERLAIAFVNPKNGHMHGYTKWRRYVRLHYR